MRTVRSMRLLASLALVVPLIAAGMDVGFTPPFAVFYRTDFDPATTAPLPTSWQIESGTWQAANGTFDSNDASGDAISTMFEYFPDPIGAPDDAVREPFTYRARLLNRNSAATSLVGVVYAYQGPLNYSEVVFSPTGTATVRRMSSGVLSDVISTSYAGGGTNVWFDVEVARAAPSTTVKVNGIQILKLSQSLGVGRVGLATHLTIGRFDKVAIAFPFGEQPFKETFTSGLTQQWQTTGQWSVGGGTFNSSVAAATTAHPLGAETGLLAEQSEAYTFRARMLNPYRGAGNLVGIQFHVGEDLDTGGPGAAEVVFSPTGVAKINVFYEGANHTVATAPYNGRQNTWFDVRLDGSFGKASVAVDGVQIFKDVATFPVAVGAVGLVTHWAPGKFDDVWYDNYAIFTPLSETFDGALPTGWAISGTWDTGGGTLNDTSATITDIVATNCGCWDTDISYHARLFNQYSGSGNLVGVVYDYQRPPIGGGGTKYQGLYSGDYDEVVFAPTGQAFMNEVRNGLKHRVAAGTQPIPARTWFDVEVLRQGATTTVKVNGAAIFNKVKQAQPTFGDVGVVTHWARAHFDDLAITDAPVR